MTSKFRALPSQARLRELFNYDQSTGELIRKTKNRRWNNTTAGICRSRRGDKPWLVLVHADGRQYPAHRLIWCWMTGDDPIASIDHIDRNPFNNRWDNLRLADNWLQSQNREWTATLGHKGISYNKASGKWLVRKVVDGNRVLIGFFETMEEAVNAMSSFMDKLKKENDKWSTI